MQQTVSMIVEMLREGGSPGLESGPVTRRRKVLVSRKTSVIPLGSYSAVLRYVVQLRYGAFVFCVKTMFADYNFYQDYGMEICIDNQLI